MDARTLTPRYSVSPQISVEDVPAIVAAGYTTVICNRPDSEVPPSHQAAAIRAAVEEAGLTFLELPLTHQTMTPENVALQRSYYDAAAGPVLAYCASGTRCSVAWALGLAGEVAVSDIMTTTQNAGYDLSGLRPTLEELAAQKS
ncbi:TIGR01244 family sulfur transferase [Tritonibacter horizontis]|uniref:Beta-lactamase hydrolase-like protein n=1 Tax=Tritonibacter horizontis TaxID=1768241 RepID=A0A132BV92_9RHOB|nr:TIGR01244 family sulfur transferase [Tritonibacter horizontis]KUP92305.1 beta-lactamase hydrolase-like protein [Tritonibacter horizontis]